MPLLYIVGWGGAKFTEFIVPGDTARPAHNLRSLSNLLYRMWEWLLVVVYIHISSCTQFEWVLLFTSTLTGHSSKKVFKQLNMYIWEGTIPVRLV